MCIGGFRKPCIDQAVGGKWDVIGGRGEQATIQLVVSTWSRINRKMFKVFNGYVLWRRGD
jgi:hypothetical protein